MATNATEFHHLDTRLYLAPPGMPDDAYGELVAEWVDAAVSFVTAKPIAANDGRALAAKLRAFARLVEELDGSEFGEHVRAMAAAIVKDVGRVE
jgi:hypothetical protein